MKTPLRSAALTALLFACSALAQQPSPPAGEMKEPTQRMGAPMQPGAAPGAGEVREPAILAPFERSALAAASAYPILRVPVSPIHPGNVFISPNITNPLQEDPQAVARGMTNFIHFNCVGCHAPNGGGGMGPSLSNRVTIYGASDGQLFLSIYQGRPNGMPAWGGVLPETVIWELVAYVRRIMHGTENTFGRTTSASPQQPNIQQVPAEFLQTSNPWAFTEAFTAGKAPSGR